MKNSYEFFNMFNSNVKIKKSKAFINTVFGFTLAEAILTMTILGIIAATMVTVLKPSQYKQQGFDALKKKMYADLDRTTQTILVECTEGGNINKLYPDCDRSAATTTFGATSGSVAAILYRKYLKGTANVSGCEHLSGYTYLKFKNGACVYFGPSGIKVDVNGKNKPNDASDQFCTTMTDSGISIDLDDVTTDTCSNWSGTCPNAGGIAGCKTANTLDISSCGGSETEKVVCLECCSGYNGWSIPFQCSSAHHIVYSINYTCQPGIEYMLPLE